MNKSPDAFRTISEVAEVLEIPAHVLRFWESRFPQVRPVKRAGGRRYYRPADVALLVGIKRLLHYEGMTIRGVQKILREQGVRVVSGVPDMAVELDADLTEDGAFDTALPDDGAFAGGLDGATVRPPAEIVLQQGPLDGHGPGDVAADLQALEPDDAALWDRDALVPAQLRDGHDSDLSETWGEYSEYDLPADDDVAFDDVARSVEAPDIPPAFPSSTEAEPASGAFSDLSVDPAAQPDSAVPPDTATPAARLRALHAAALPLPHAPLEALATRLAALRTRMSAAARPHRR